MPPDTEPVNAGESPGKPTPDGVAGELWRIVTGDGSESARVSALRTLADIFGLLRAAPPELPAAMSQLLDAISRGFNTDHETGQNEPRDGSAATR